MSFKQGLGNNAGELSKPVGLEAQEAELKPLLADFRSSVHVWSENAYSRPRPAFKTAPHWIWQRVAGWALGCVLVVGGVSGAVHERHHQQEMARIAAARQAEQQQLAAQQRAREEEELLAKVDSDVSREVPSAMEPLALTTADDETR
jgi:uncharacterized protein HemX